MALLYMDDGHPERASGALKTALEIREKTLGAENPGLLPELDRLASTWLTLRLYDKAEEAYRRALVIRERVAGAAEAELIPTLDGLAYACFGQKKYEDAEALYKRLLATWEKSAGGDHPMVALTLDKLAMFYRDQKRWDEGVAAAERATALRALFLANGLAQEAGERLARGDRKEAEQLYRRALAALDPSRSEHGQLREQIEGSLKELAPRKSAPARKPAATKRK